MSMETSGRRWRSRSALLTLGCYRRGLHRAATFAETLGLDGKADVAGLPLLVLDRRRRVVLFTPMANALSRAHERRADRYALDTTRNSTAFISAMKRLAATESGRGASHPGSWSCSSTHPSTAARIDAAKRGARWLGRPRLRSPRAIKPKAEAKLPKPMSRAYRPRTTSSPFIWAWRASLVRLE